MEEKRKRSSKTDPDQFPCPICGESAFVWGKTNRSDAGWLGFKPDGSGIFSVGEEVGARQCQSCGNIQLFTRFY